MQAKILYVIAFLVAFGLTTGAMIYLNDKYKNIFKFDFSPADHSMVQYKTAAASPPKQGPAGQENQDQKSLDEFAISNQESSLESKGDFQQEPDMAAEELKKEKAAKEIARQLDSLKNAKQQEVELLKKKLADKDKEVETIKANVKVKEDTTYIKWTKTMAKIYEKMDARAVAKIIQKLADNQARDILSTMKQNKVAQVLTQLDPDTATRLTRIK